MQQTTERVEEIVAAYNSDKNRVTIEETFEQLTDLLVGLEAEEQRGPEEGLREDELALFDLFKKDKLSRTDRERVKQASRELLAAIKERLAELDPFWEKEQTKADVEVFVLDQVYATLPTPRSRRKRRSRWRMRSTAISGNRLFEDPMPLLLDGNYCIYL